MIDQYFASARKSLEDSIQEQQKQQCRQMQLQPLNIPITPQAPQPSTSADFSSAMQQIFEKLHEQTMQMHQQNLMNLQNMMNSLVIGQLPMQVQTQDVNRSNEISAVQPMQVDISPNYEVNMKSMINFCNNYTEYILVKLYN